MALITLPFIYVAGQTLPAFQLNADFQTIYNDYNGNITNANIAANAAITLTKLGLDPGVEAFNQQITGNRTWSSGLTTDTLPRIAFTSDGWLLGGPGGNVALDVYMWRSAANTWQMNIPGGGAPTLDMNNGSIINVANLGGNITLTGTVTITTLHLVNPLAVQYGGTGANTLSAHGVLIGEGTSPIVSVVPGVTGTVLTSTGVAVDPSFQYPNFGALNNFRPAPTIGALTGTYWTAANWTQTGAITCNGARLFFGGTVTFNNTVTVTAGIEGNAGGGNGTSAAGNPGFGFVGAGPGAGPGGVSNSSVDQAAGGGGSAGGTGGGGSGTNVGANAGLSYPNDFYLPGSGGGGGVSISAGASGGAGGGGLYVEAIGAISLTGAAAITANGVSVGAQTGNYASGGGGGGGVDLRSLGAVTLAVGGTITCNGGGGGTNGGLVFGGGGGAGGFVQLMSFTGGATNAGTITVTGGTGGTGGTGTGTNGGAGTVSVNPTFSGPRLNW